MISVTSATKNYILQPELIRKHKKALQWLSTTIMWKGELIFFQKALIDYAPLFYKLKDKKKIDHFENLFLYYSGEVVDSLRSKLRQHENRLASALKTKNETSTRYFREHDSLMDELSTFSKSYNELKADFLKFISSANKKG
ncbi:hypothetical protein WSM22_41730 [Cytophagales bacterium WSM2-2]|nr:hypothetical protein WSM22_41730 [Cytophagales bacterium WSM2-2]